MSFLPTRSLPWPIVLATALLAAAAQAAAPSEKISFNQQIRPILSGTCFYCHGPDEKHREGHLRLDTLEGATADHEGTRAIVPGKPAESELLTRLLSHDPEESMPPPKAKKPAVTVEQIALLRQWIEQGAPYESHWAFLPLKHSEPPLPIRRDWAHNPIDQFILSRLEQDAISPSPEADRPTLIRRLSLDLTGLLPTPEQVQAFLNDSTPNAYEKLVDQLLASPHYGERWGRHWLDQARYADSNGYSIDGDRAMWPYRDWVIKALNEDLPFDQFTLDQLAGDLLPKPTKAQLIATAFHRNTLINEEGGTKPEQFRVESVIDRVNTTGAVWLGLTLGCAQCHSHKFDPISHREYYQMFAFFNQSQDVNNKGPTLEVARGEVFGTAPSAESRRAEFNKEIATRLPQWEAEQMAALESSGVEAGSIAWSPANYLEYETASNAGFRLLSDNSLLADGGASFNDRYRIVATSSLKRIAAVRLRVIPHPSLPKSGPGLASNGNFVLTGFDISAGGKVQAIRRAVADHEQPGYPAAAAIDDQARSGWAINIAKASTAKMNTEHEIVFVLEQPIEGSPLEFQLHHDLNENYLIGRFALEFSELIPGKTDQPLEPWQKALLVAPKARTAAQTKLIREAFERAHPEATKKLPEIAELMVMKEVTTPRLNFLFQRGDFLRPDEKLGPLQPGIIQAVQASMPKPTSPMTNRLDLARWLIQPQNPLTPRVTMNRTWMHYFGRGLVETEEDFGSQGSSPTHPELLDWLAKEFIQSGWSQKHMHRLIVTSSTYRQSSKARPELSEKDPRNLLLARQERLRVEAEIVRDAALSASGLLEATIGGPSVRPPQPAGVYSFTQNQRQWNTSTGPDRYRRGLYTTFYRSAPHPLFTTFDTPDLQTVCTRRVRSNTPLQALTMANDEAFFELAQGLAARVLREVNQNPEAWLRRAYWLSLSREPSATELSVLAGYFAAQAKSFAQDLESAQSLLTPALRSSGSAAEQAAAMVCVARAILNTDSFITRE